MYFRRKSDRHGNERYVFCYYYEDGKLKCLPRAQTKHLDGQPDHNIRFFIEEWEARNGKDRASASTELTHPGLLRLVDQYLAFMAKRGKDSKTVESHRRGLVFHALPSLLDLDYSNTDPNYWPNHTARLWEAMSGRGITDNNIRLANIAMRGLWEWMCTQPDLVLHKGTMLRLLSPVGGRKETPLKKAWTPEEVLAFARKRAGKREALMALLGYFFSLRPQELFAAERKHFKAGTKASDLQACKNMRAAKLGSLLAYNVQCQRDEDGDESPPKVDSRGWVACFNDDAARLIVAALKALPEIGYLFPQEVGSLYAYWRRNGLPGATLKDLRRASILWLGHNSNLGQNPIHLQKHARHLDFDSTEKYLRAPEPESEAEIDPLDLDA
jgi:integrase